jgi:hypothetical protein
LSAAALFQLDVADEIRANYPNAHCIPWDDRRDSGRAIAECRAAFEAAGWRWNSHEKQLEKDGWFAWFRSQGNLASPILQFSRIPADAVVTIPAQFDLFGGL